MMINYMEAIECGLDELDVLSLDGEAERLKHEFRLGSLERAPGRRERLRDDRALRRGALDAICNDTGHAETTTAPSSATVRSQCAGEGGGEKHAPRYDWMDCWSAANLPRLAAHSLSMASKARVTNPPAAPAMAADLSSGRGDGGKRAKWLDPRMKSGHGMERARDLEGMRDLKEETGSPRCCPRLGGGESDLVVLHRHSRTHAHARSADLVSQTFSSRSPGPRPRVRAGAYTCLATAFCCSCAVLC